MSRLYVLLLASACGRLGFEPLAVGSDAGDEPVGGDFRVDVRPAWALPSGGTVEIATEIELVAPDVRVGDSACAQLEVLDARTLRCMLTSHVPATVDVAVTTGDLRGTRRFTYVTPGMYQHGGPLDDRTSGIAVDGEGNVYVTGATNGDLDGASAGDYDALLVKYDAAGQLVWVRQLGSAEWDYARDVATDRFGDVTITGYTLGDIDGDGTIPGGNDIFVARYASDGTRKWVAHTGTPGDDQAWDLAVDDAGYTVVAARTDNAFAGSTNAGLVDYAVLRYTPQGELAWASQAGTAADDIGRSIAAAPDGTAFLVGYTTGAVEQGVTPAGQNDMFVARFETDGARTWVRQRGGTGEDFAHDVTVDPEGDVWVAGQTNAMLDGKAPRGGGDVFVMRFSADGAWQLTRTFGSNAMENSWGIGVSQSGTVYVSCVTAGAFDGQSNAGGNDFCMVAYDRNGTHQWTRITGTAGADTSSSCAVDLGHTGLAYISLMTDASLDGRPNRGGNDIAVAKLDAFGELR